MSLNDVGCSNCEHMDECKIVNELIDCVVKNRMAFDDIEETKNDIYDIGYRCKLLVKEIN